MNYIDTGKCIVPFERLLGSYYDKLAIKMILLGFELHVFVYLQTK